MGTKTETGNNGRQSAQTGQAVASSLPRALEVPSHAPRLLSVKQAAAYLSVSVWTIRSLGWSGEVPQVKIGRRVLYDRADLDRFIEASKGMR